MRVKKPDPNYKEEWCVVLGMVVLGIAVLFMSFNAKADYIYEANQDLYDLQTNSSGSTGLGSNDDSVSAAFDLGFTFTFYGNDYTQARMATNGCLHFNLTGSYCGDYTPDPLPQYTNTLFPFWTDLIKDGGSAMRAKAFDDYTIFGWYNMREYNRANSDNSIEVWLYPNDTYEFRYGELDIISHDVLIGEQGSSSQIYTYHFFDECNTGTTNIAGTCVSYDWNSSSNAVNTLLEDGGSLYGDGTDQSACATTPLTSVNCAGYAAAYLAQQCALNSLHSESCDGYEVALFDYECDQDSQYSPSCPGYSFQESVAYYEPETFDYGYDEPDYSTGNYYEEDLYWEEDLFGMGDYSDDCIDNPSYCYDSLAYEETYGVEEIIWFEDNLGWEEENYLVEDPFLSTYDPIEIITYEEIFFEPVFESEYLPEIVETIDIFDAEELVDIYELELIVEEDFRNEEELFAETFDTIEELDEWFEEETEEEFEEERFAHEEEFEEEIFEEEVVEEIFEEIEEERIAEAEAEEVNEEIEVVASLEIEEGSSINREMALNVVANTIQAAANSVSGTLSGNSVHSGGYSSASGGSSSSTVGVGTGNSGVNNAVASSSTGGGFSTSSSPSMSDQFASASVQTNTVLSMSSDTGAVSNVSVVVTPMPTLDANLQVVMADVQVNDMQGEIDTAISGVMTASEADQIADQIIADNIKEQQEQGQATQEETGQYGDESTLVAFLGYVPGFDAYREATIPQAETWYEPRAIYANASISDNINAYYGLARTNLNTMQNLINQQPNL
jgi:hypothetical protein